MKRERRHELERNALARQIEKHLAWLQPHLKWVAIAVLIVFVALSFNAFMAQQSASRMEAAWEEFLQASAAMDRRKALEDVAAFHETRPAGIWALLSKADMDLQQGAQLIYENRSEAERFLKDAITGFEDVLQLAGKQPFLAQRAQYGIALAYETMAELRKARQAYEDVVSMGETTALGELAKERAERLQDERIQTFYAWLADQEDAPSDMRMPDMPRDLGDLPDFPDFQLPRDFSIPGLDPPADALPDDPLMPGVVPPSDPVPPDPVPPSDPDSDPGPDSDADPDSDAEPDSDSEPSSDPEPDLDPAPEQPSETEPSEAEPSEAEPSDEQAADEDTDE